MKGSAEFYLHSLIEEPKSGWLVTAPSNSPENAFIKVIDGQKVTVPTCMAPTCDMQILRELFGNCIKASEILGVDEDFRARLKTAKARLAPNQIAKNGTLQEWLYDYEETEPGHRHNSHLYGVYPGEEITPEGTPKFAKAVEASLKRRLEHGTYWLPMWRGLFWARLGFGDTALARSVEQINKFSSRNLFHDVGPFQIDGNLSGPPIVCEMLMQSHAGLIRLLPALPKHWQEGSLKGICARGGFVIDIDWAEGKLTKAKITSRVGGPCKLKWTGPIKVTSAGKNVKVRRVSDTVIEFDTSTGAVYTITQ